MEQQFSSSDLEALAARFIEKAFHVYRIFAFVGPLGVGKTTLIKEILRQQGVVETVDSPTFGYVRSYIGKYQQRFNHFDLYRIESIEGFQALGFDEYLYAQNEYCFIEWPEVIYPLLERDSIKNHVCFVQLEYDVTDQEKRSIAWQNKYFHKKC